MIINSAIVHRLEKEKHGQPLLDLRDEALPIDENLTFLISSIRKLYSEKTGRGYGVFDADTVNYPFSTLLTDHCEGIKNFVDFTHMAMTTLESKIQSVQLATGGYVLFVSYNEGDRQYLIVASIKHRPGLAFDNDLNLTGSMHIDQERLHEMSRVDISEWKNGGTRYLSFAKRKLGTDDFSKYFRDFIGCDDFSSSTEMNTLVLNAVKAFGVERGLDQSSQRQLRAVVYNYFEEKSVAKEQVSLTMLSQRINETEPEAFLTFINERHEEFPISDGFDPVKSVYKRLKTFVMSDKSLKIQFDQDDFGTRIVLNPDGTLLVRQLTSTFLKELREFEHDG